MKENHLLLPSLDLFCSLTTRRAKVRGPKDFPGDIVISSISRSPQPTHRKGWSHPVGTKALRRRRNRGSGRYRLFPPLVSGSWSRKPCFQQREVAVMTIYQCRKQKMTHRPFVSS